MVLRSPRSMMSTEWMYPPWRTITPVISYSTPVRSTPRHTMANGGVLVEFAGASGTGCTSLLVHAQQAADRLDDRHLAQRADGVLDSGFVGHVGGQDNFGAWHIVAQDHTFLLHHARQADP